MRFKNVVRISDKIIENERGAKMPLSPFLVENT